MLHFRNRKLTPYPPLAHHLLFLTTFPCFQHLHLHATAARGSQSWVQCKIQRCNQRNHRSREELLLHLEETHLSRIALSCPISACGNVRLLKPGDVLKHVTDFHPEIFAGTIAQAHSQLTKTLRPFRPTFPLPELDQLPTLPFVGLVPVRRSKRRTKDPTAALLAPPKIPRHPRQVATAEIDDGSSDVEEEFDDLETWSSCTNGGTSHEELVERWTITGQPNDSIKKYLSHPPLPINVDLYPYQEPPTSIGFEPFKERIEVELRKIGRSLND
ncbi:hypothetical protein BKA70DRAFT_480191 [Coprinopsis sp. MPI-PUGE-AT-0042]|nr:hypothetical protein BKA70DRAFT_480191 [Coprinopsis sp. MPI-PUGE-AT-0042]